MSQQAIIERLSPRVAAAIAIVAAALLITADVTTGLAINFAIFKGVPLILAAAARSRRLLWALAAVLLVATVGVFWAEASYYADVDPASFRVLLINRTFAMLAMLLVASILHVWIGADVRAQQAAREIALHNQDLAAREEEIQRQNEELQSQTEELERQSEELRVANEELAQRERMLETLLDLSRSLHVGLSHDETLGRICETLGQMVNGPNVTTAILLNVPKQGVKVRCHYGFGPDGIVNEVIPHQQSFSSLVIEQGRTGYLEDLSLRPDIKVPQPAVGEAMVSVLATPLVVRAKSIGTVEIYSRERRHWSDEQIALLESLAAQTAISLENALLFDEVERNRRRLTTILENIPVGLTISNADLTDIRFNAAGAGLIGAPPDTNIAEEFARTAWVLFQDGKQLPRDRYPVARAARGERVYPQEVEVALPTGRRLTVLSSASPIYDADAKVIGAVSSFADITQLKLLQRELETRRREAEEANVRKTRFLAAASHDIRTPANAISLLAELLKRTADSPSMAAEIPQLADELRQSANALVNLVSNVLDVTRFDTDRLELHETEFPLAQLLEEESRQVLPLAQAKHLILDIEHPGRGGDAIWLRADRIKLGRVIGNLLGNAIKFTDTGGIRVTARRLTAASGTAAAAAAGGNGSEGAGDGQRAGAGEAGGVEIAVTDTGIGISAENQVRIFDEFWQLSEPSRSKGSGLGLSISKRLIQAMDGSISVQSNAGKGSTFAITLPASSVVVRPDADAAGSTKP
ncbi:MAG TPA: ATP-binding protein [Tepidisphaeraceae bacterium]|nr:ATP-binding protein [Tepidisphaeraceae bacterium]